MIEKEMDKTKNDFSQGPVWKCIITQAVPLTIAQLVQLLYNVVDRIYIGHMGDGSSIALTGVGLTFPLSRLLWRLLRCLEWAAYRFFPWQEAQEKKSRQRRFSVILSDY